MPKRLYRVEVTVEGDNPGAGLTSVSGREISEQSADINEIGRRIRGTYAHVPHMAAVAVPAGPDPRITAALALQAEHVRGLGAECVCLGCQMARALRGEEPR